MNESKSVSPWWETLGLPKSRLTPTDIETAADNLGWQAVINPECPPLYQGSRGGVLKAGWKDISEKLVSLGGRLIVQDVPENDGYRVAFYIWSAGVVRAGYNKEHCSLDFALNDKELVKELLTYAKENFSLVKAAGEAYVLINGSHGLQLTTLGQAGLELERGNYAPDVLEAYDHVVEDLAASTPCGRVVLLEGEPGTGKTFLVYAMMAQVEDAMFVYVPSNMVSRLVTPDFMTVLINTKNNSGNEGAIILVVEDADSCLVSRQADNMDDVSALLNLGEGVLGRMLDIRVIATTNARKTDIDSALIRPGRLCRRLSVGKLDAGQAVDVLCRLAGTGIKEANLSPEHFWDKWQRGATLADIYAEARKYGWKPDPKLGRPEKSEEPDLATILDDL